MCVCAIVVELAFPSEAGPGSPQTQGGNQPKKRLKDKKEERKTKMSCRQSGKKKHSMFFL